MIQRISNFVDMDDFCVHENPDTERRLEVTENLGDFKVGVHRHRDFEHARLRRHDFDSLMMTFARACLLVFMTS